MVKRKKRKVSGRKVRKVRVKKDVDYKRLLLSILLPVAALFVVYFSYSIITSFIENRRGISQIRVSDASQQKAKTDKGDSVYKIQVLNGCGAKGVAVVFTNYLRKQGFDVVEKGNYNLVGSGGSNVYWDMKETIVIDRSGVPKAVQKIGKILGTPNIIQQISNDLMVDATVIIGHDYKQLSVFK